MGIPGFGSVALLCVCLLSVSSAVEPQHGDAVQPITIANLDPKLVGKEATVKFTVTKLNGVAQRAVEGQASTFRVETDFGKQENRLSVWIEGDLANVLDRLEMSFLQENQLKVGTTIVAKGILSVHTMDSRLYSLSITKWQNFRILPSPKNSRHK